MSYYLSSVHGLVLYTIFIVVITVLSMIVLFLALCKFAENYIGKIKDDEEDEEEDDEEDDEEDEEEDEEGKPVI